MEKKKIQKAAQLHDQLLKVKKAIGLMSDADDGTVKIRISGTVGDKVAFAYLPENMSNAIYGALLAKEESINHEMEEL